MSQSMDAILALDKPADPPFLMCEPVIVSAEVEVWSLGDGRCLWWLRPSVGDTFIRFIERQYFTIVSDDVQTALRCYMALRRELST